MSRRRTAPQRALPPSGWTDRFCPVQLDLGAAGALQVVCWWDAWLPLSWSEPLLALRLVTLVEGGRWAATRMGRVVASTVPTWMRRELVAGAVHELRRAAFGVGEVLRRRVGGRRGCAWRRGTRDSCPGWGRSEGSWLAAG